MKYVWTVLVMLALAGDMRAANGETQPPLRTISVSGSAVGHVPADTILWNVTLLTADKTVVEAKVSSDGQVKGLVDACTRLGIQGSNIVVGIMRIQDARMEEVEARDASKPFNVTRVVTIRQQEPRLFREMLEMLSRGKGYGVRYDVVSSRTDQIKKETMVKATETAKEKAAAMAAVLGAQLGNVQTINEYPPVGWNSPDSSILVDQSSTAFGVDAETIRITIFVTFEIQ
ncbi:MAG: hypothetical protein A2340_00590 [Lentisphaerae bacterium RIFOXYB12_FULL_60_10]|nr:MAG: hypothetical protein A2340_00590 [Lentisphaerae bacterium RIFOXYB12_FULL_60_10]